MGFKVYNSKNFIEVLLDNSNKIILKVWFIPITRVLLSDDDDNIIINGLLLLLLLN